MSRTPRMMPDGTLVFPRRGSKPPECLDGYRRKSEHGPDAWILIPLFRDCIFRTQVLRRREECNCERLTTLCGHPDKLEQQEISFEICNQCNIACPSS